MNYKPSNIGIEIANDLFKAMLRLLKKIISLFLLLLALNSYGQIPKNANVIIAKNVTFRQAVNTLMDAGFMMDKIDSNYNTVTTEYKKICNDCLPEMMLNIRIKDSTAILTGKWRSTGNIFQIGKSTKDEYLIFDIMNEKSKVPKVCFFEMDRIARTLSPDVSYQKN